MSSINIYRIDSEKNVPFMQAITDKMSFINTVVRTAQLGAGEGVEFGVSLYILQNHQPKDLAWSWLLKEFDKETISIPMPPSAILVIERDDETLYTVTFGHAFFLADKYCDRDFGFSFARRTEFEEINTTTLTAPNSQRNKTISTYINYNQLEFDSGESFAKLKAKAILPQGFNIIKQSMEIGSSIRFVLNSDSIENILISILYIEKTLEGQERYRIPVFTKVKSPDKLDRLEQNLSSAVQSNPAIHISELDIIGATEIFNRNDCEFSLKYQRKEKAVASLSAEEIRTFCSENGFVYEQCVLDIKVVSCYNGSPIRTATVKQLIDYTDDNERCLLSKGVWYNYNDDYISYLSDSISEITAEYHPEYDFPSQKHDAFIESLLPSARQRPEFRGMTDLEIKASLKRKYYAERAFNMILHDNHGYELYDRIEHRVGTADIELMDVYKDNAMFAVKIGNSSSKLCYAVDQSISSLRLYKHRLLPNIPSINTVVIWLILERSGHIEDADGVPQINSLNMLLLKNKLDQWKKEVRLQGLQPLIYINYRQ